MPTDMVEKINSLKEKALADIQSCKDAGQLDELKTRYLGRKSELTSILRSIGSLSPEERPSIGKAASELKRILTKAIENKAELLTEDRFDRKKIDLTLPGRVPFTGSIHPLTAVMDEIIDIFSRMGFTVADGPDIETDYYNFTALNTPEDHPAKDVSDTFFIEGDDILLRTQTSPVQIRTMEKTTPPVRIICPGRCYRNDTPDATHFPMFHQVEGLYVDEDVTMGDLKGVLECFARQFFDETIKLRFRPHFFPFTEPSAECDFTCVMCKGRGCNLCKHTGWLEILGCGMVDPEVFRYVNYDPERYTGFAFGMGVERLAMIRYGISDIRLFYENDMRFLSQF